MHAPQLQELAPVRRTFRSVVEAVVPEALELDDGGWARLEEIVEDALGSRPRPQRVQLRALLRAIRWLPVLRWGRTFPSLSLDARRRFLAFLQDAPVLLLRRGFWGVRTLAFLGFYGREEVHRELGYGVRPRGREERPGPVRGRGRGELPESTPGRRERR